jgi:catechol 2,3-dioxygenase-like lactoylglutathione lyase family enzyme
MKRLHVHVGVADLEQSIGFYSTLFGIQPTMRRHDYAKWMLDDPRVNFAISARSGQAGLDHLGMQAESADELAEIADRLKAAGLAPVEQCDAACCYARSDKAWTVDPAGLRWETFHSTGAVTTYGEDSAPTAASTTLAKAPTPAAPACCGPQAVKIAGATQAATSCCS